MLVLCSYCLKELKPRKLGESHDESHGACHVCQVRVIAEIGHMCIYDCNTVSYDQRIMLGCSSCGGRK